MKNTKRYNKTKKYYLEDKFELCRKLFNKHYIDRIKFEDCLKEAKSLYRIIILKKLNFLYLEELLLMLAKLYEEDGDPVTALKYYKKILKINKNRPDIYNRIAAIQLMKWDFDLSLSYIKKSIKLDPSFLPAYSTLLSIFEKIRIEEKLRFIKNILRQPNSISSDFIKYLIYSMEFLSKKKAYNSIHTELHSIKNKISIIGIKLGDITAKSKDKSLQKILNDIDKIIRNFANFMNAISRDNISIKNIDLNKLIKEIAALNSINKRNKIKYYLDKKLSLIYCDEKSIKEMLENLLNNAVEASDKNGIIKIITEYDVSEKTVIIKIIDFGGGISSEIYDRIFNIGFSTKLKGSGLGLTIVQNIVEKHLGKLYIYSDGNRETTAEVVLPIDRLKGLKYD